MTTRTRKTTYHIKQSWQCNKGVIERNAHMLEHELATDVIFNIVCTTTGARKTIKAHKCMLISASPVFWSLLCGGMQKSGYIDVCDDEPHAFKEMLRFIYTDEPSLNRKNVMHVLYMAKKYQLPMLAQKCVEFLDRELNASNACDVLEHSIYFHEAELAQKCMTIIEQNTAEAFAAEEFMEISKGTLATILQNDNLSMPEINIFERCYHWAQRKCANVGSASEALGEALYKIRFPTMSAPDFVGKVCATDVLSEQDQFKILKYITMKDNSAKDDTLMPFSCKPRAPPKGMWVRIRQYSLGVRMGEVLQLRSIGNGVVTVLTAGGPATIPTSCVEQVIPSEGPDTIPVSSVEAVMTDGGPATIQHFVLKQ